MVLSNPLDIRLPPVKIGDDVPPSARGVMRSLADLVNQCTAIQPDARPTFAEILEARFAASYSHVFTSIIAHGGGRRTEA